MRSPTCSRPTARSPTQPQPLPQNPPKGIEVYPATTNRTVEGPIEYDRKPPTNGNHAPLWQNCGFYGEPIQDRHAVHSMDHGVVWITYRPDLPQQQIETLRPYGNENYVIVSPYPGQDAPVIATSWRVQLELNSANDPRLEQFVNEFKVSELAPLSGNRCTLGVGEPGGLDVHRSTQRHLLERRFADTCSLNARYRPRAFNPECPRRRPLSPPRSVPG